MTRHVRAVLPYAFCSCIASACSNAAQPGNDGGPADSSVGMDAPGPGDSGTQQDADAAATAPPLVMYSNGVIDLTRWPAADDYSYGTTPSDDYTDKTSPEPGHQYDLFVNMSAGWQQATNWGVSPPNGLDVSRYTKLQLDIKPPAGSQIALLAHATRSTGDDLQLNTGVDDLQTVPGVGTFKPGEWNVGVQIPLCHFGLASAFNYYKFAMQNNGTGNAAFYLDNVQFVAGQTAWIYNGDPGVGGLVTGWADASASAVASYKFAPNTIRTSVYAANNPPQASSFMGTVSGTTLTVSSLVGTIVAGEHLVQFAGGPVVWGTIVSGSGTTWTIAGSGGDYSNISSGSAWLESDVNIIKLTTSAKNGMWRASYAGGFDLAPYTDFTFAASPTLTGNSYVVQGYDTSGAALGTPVTISPGSLTYTSADRGVSPTGSYFYTVYAIPLGALGLSGMTVGGISIKDNTSNQANTIYLSAIGFFS
jgi:hypothetical protein